jgi:AraC family transcriptional regulator
MATLTSAGRWSSHKWAEHTHSRVQIVLALDPVDAVISWKFRGKQERRGVAGQFVWLLPANTPRSAEWHGVAGMVVLLVDPEFVRSVCECDVTTARLEEFSSLIRFDLRVWHLAEDFRRLCHGGHRTDAPLAESMGTLLAAYLLRSLHRSGAKGAPGLSNAKLREVLDYIDTHLRETITRVALARIARLGVRSFVRQFRQRTGLTPCDYVRRRRTTRALE